MSKNTTQSMVLITVSILLTVSTPTQTHNYTQDYLKQLTLDQAADILAYATELTITTEATLTNIKKLLVNNQYATLEENKDLTQEEKLLLTQNLIATEVYFQRKIQNTVDKKNLFIEPTVAYSVGLLPEQHTAKIKPIESDQFKGALVALTQLEKSAEHSTQQWCGMLKMLQKALSKQPDVTPKTLQVLQELYQIALQNRQGIKKTIEQHSPKLSVTERLWKLFNT